MRVYTRYIDCIAALSEVNWRARKPFNLKLHALRQQARVAYITLRYGSGREKKETASEPFIIYNVRTQTLQHEYAYTRVRVCVRRGLSGIRLVIIDTIWEFRKMKKLEKKQTFIHTWKRSRIFKSPTRGGGGLYTVSWVVFFTNTRTHTQEPTSRARYYTSGGDCTV